MNESTGKTSAAVLVLVRESSLGRNVLLIERSATVKTHQGQVSFPGGGMEPSDLNDPIRTALRECEEEVGISDSGIQIHKILPALPTRSSSFEVVPVLGIWKSLEEPDLNVDPAEVAHAEWVSVECLLRTKRAENGYPVFEWVGRDFKVRKVWGLTAVIFHLFFDPEAPAL